MGKKSVFPSLQNLACLPGTECLTVEIIGLFIYLLLAKDVTQVLWLHNKTGREKKKNEKLLFLTAIIGRKSKKFKVNLFSLFLKI